MRTGQSEDSGTLTATRLTAKRLPEASQSARASDEKSDARSLSLSYRKRVESIRVYGVVSLANAGNLRLSTAMRATRAAVGFRVKSGWATAVVISGSARGPHLCISERINLSDPRDATTQQPYHAAMGELETDETKLEQRIETVRRATEQSIVDLVRRCAADGYAVRRAGLVVGSVVEHPESIANPHIRAHALEGRLFRTVLETALQEQGIGCSIFRERDIYVMAAKSLGQSPAQIKQTLTNLGDSVKAPWRGEQKLAGLAAWLVL